MDGPVPGGWSAAEQEEIWVRRRRGEALRTIARRFGRDIAHVRRFLLHTGGRRLPPRRRAKAHLTAPEREEVARHGGRAQYRAGDAEGAARRRAKRRKPAVLAARPALRAVVEAKLALRWSPEQIAHWLKRAYPDDPGMRVSHETIYLSLFVQSRGALKRELTKELRTGRAMRFPRGARARRGQGHGQLVGTVSIRERPAEAEDRAVPGHWEGDLVFGRHHSAVGTLVERTSRYLLLFPVPGGYKGGPMREALAAAITRLPDQLRRSLTWDNGKEMSEHARFTVDSGVQVYICDPRSPWQRGTNENTNGLLRQYLPKAADLRVFDQAALDAVAAELNGRPREPLSWRTPGERFLELAEAG